MQITGDRTFHQHVQRPWGRAWPVCLVSSRGLELRTDFGEGIGEPNHRIPCRALAKCLRAGLSACKRTGGRNAEVTGGVDGAMATKHSTGR